MIRSFFNNLEDPERPLLGPNYKLLKLTGLIFREGKFGKLISIICLQSITLAVVTAAMELFIVRSDKDTVLENLKLTTVSIVCMAKANTFVIWQNRWKEVIDYVTEADKYERLICDEIKAKIIDKYTKKCRIITYSYAGLIYMTFFTIVGTPFWVYLSSETLRDNIENGTQPFPHILSTWMPFDKNHFPGNWITVVFHASLVAWGAGILPGSDTTILSIMVFFGGKLELLRERCQTMLGSDDTKVTDDEANKMIGELHQTHVMLLKHMKLFNSMISPVMFTFVIVCSMMICASAIQVTAATSLVEMTLLSVYVVCAIAQLFLFCWFSSDILEKNEQVMMGPYESQWWAGNARQRKSVMILAGQLSIIHNFTAGPFTSLTLTMFVSVIKAAYSYFTLLRE